MLVRRGKLISFGEFKRGAQADISMPGEIYPGMEPVAFSMEGDRIHVPLMWWDSPFEGLQRISEVEVGLGAIRRIIGKPISTPRGVRPFPGSRIMGKPTGTPRRIIGKPAGTPRGVRPFPGSSFKRFSGGQSLRRWGKIRMLKKLDFLPSGNDQASTIPFKGIRKIPQKPQYFPELAGFGDVPVGVGDSFGSASPDRGIWGDLISVLTTAGQVVLETQTQRTQREVAASQASIAASQTQTMQAKVLSTLYSNLPLLIALAGGGTLLYIYMTKKKKVIKG